MVYFVARTNDQMDLTFTYAQGEDWEFETHASRTRIVYVDFHVGATGPSTAIFHIIRRVIILNMYISCIAFAIKIVIIHV